DRCGVTHAPRRCHREQARSHQIKYSLYFRAQKKPEINGLTQAELPSVAIVNWLKAPMFGA
ncbi:hypothetical protein, partial [Pseudomonas sp.]|uniref:hypothetical protein n=1 Tax=Pseudomonas sp. TaxID=306 RepID=UPI0026489AA1